LNARDLQNVCDKLDSSFEIFDLPPHERHPQIINSRFPFKWRCTVNGEQTSDDSQNRGISAGKNAEGSLKAVTDCNIEEPKGKSRANHRSPDSPQILAF
jgi:hypothetical protein